MVGHRHCAQEVVLAIAGPLRLLISTAISESHLPLHIERHGRVHPQHIGLVLSVFQSFLDLAGACVQQILLHHLRLGPLRHLLLLIQDKLGHNNGWRYQI